MCLRKVGCPRRLAGLASFEDCHDSYLCSELIPSVAERSAVFVKELSSHRRRQTDDAFSTGTGLERAGIAGPVRCLWTLDIFVKTRNKKGSAGAHPLPLRCLSQFFPVEGEINCLGNEVLCICLRTFHRWGGLVFIMDDHDNFPSWMMTHNNIFPCWRMIRYSSH